MTLVHTHTHDKVAWVTLSRPEKLNAINTELLHDLGAAFAHLEHNDKVNVVILTGAGDKAFAAGADLEEIQQADPIHARSSALAGQALMNRIESFPKPVIACVNGFALGGGLELALACHIRVACEDAKFGFPEVSLGLIPGYGGTQRLPRLVGRGVALDMILTGEPISAEEALAVGLVSRVFPAPDLQAATEKLARTLLGRAPLALGHALAAVNQGLEMSPEQGMQHEAALYALLASTHDRQEGVSAFLEKRTPKFKGH